MIIIEIMKIKKAFLYISSLFTITALMSCLVTEDDVVKEGVITPPIETIEEIAEEIPRKEFYNDAYVIEPSFDFEGKISTWYQFKNAAYSATFDDGTYDQYATAFPILEDLGIKGTFYLAAGLLDLNLWDDNGTPRKMMSWIHASRIASAGHEIGSHSINHYDISKMDENIEDEILGSRKYIEERLPDVKVETFCWPHWRENSAAIKIASNHYISARSGNGVIDYYLNRKGGIPGDPPGNMFMVNALGFMNSHKDEEWQAVIKKSYERGSWFVSSYHGVDDGNLPEDHLGWSPLSSEKFRETLLYPMEMGFWFDTFANVSKYIIERDSAILHIKNKKDSIELKLDDALDDNVYNQKLSVSFKKPSNWSKLMIKNQQNEDIPYNLINDTVFIDIFPDGRPIEVKPY